MQFTWPSRPKTSTIHLPGSKSIANRLLIIRALAGADLQLQNLSDSGDTLDLFEALQHPDRDHHIEEGGTTFRFLLAYLAGREGYTGAITVGERLGQRPHDELVEALRQCGAKISITGNRYQIVGEKLIGGKLELDGSQSSQFSSALLMIAPSMQGGLQLQIRDLVSRSYLEMTVELMRENGAVVHWENDVISVTPGGYQPLTNLVESDWSAAAVWAGLVAQESGWELRLTGLRKQSLQGDSIILDLLEPLGLLWKWTDDELVLSANTSDPELLEMDLESTPDLALPIAASALGRNVPVTFYNTGHLVHKESNRAEGLRFLVEATGGSFSMDGTSIRLNPGLNTKQTDVCPTFSDHRMAFAWTILLPRFGSLDIENPEVVQKSYPNFWVHLKSIGVGGIR